jgi:hypothetical protein
MAKSANGNGNSNGNGKSWYQKGFSTTEYDKERAEQRSRFWPPNRFFLKAGEAKRIVFLDDEPFCFDEHNPTIDGDWRNWLTCLQSTYDDVVCCEKLGAKSRYRTGYYTVVDCSEWTNKNTGVVHQFEVKLFQAKVKTLKNLQVIKEKRGGLAGKMFESRRVDSKSPNVGEMFDFEREVDLEKMFEVANQWGKPLQDLYETASSDDDGAEDLMTELQNRFQLVTTEKGKIVQKIFPFNYFKLFAPKSPDAVRELLQGYTPPSAVDTGRVGADKSVPF